MRLATNSLGPRGWSLSNHP